MGDRRVMAFGTFDGLHPGHRFFLDEASKRGDLHVIVARDATVVSVKGRPPKRGERERLEALRAAGYNAELGREGDKYEVVRDDRPDIICLGYDQQAFTARLEEKCREFGLDVQIIRIPAFRPERYKSSILDADKP